MSLFRRQPRIDPQDWQRVLRRSYADFTSVYDPAHVNTHELGRSPLLLALGNNDPASRVAIANRLLDDGARVDSGHPLHVLLGQNRHDQPVEARLLERLIEAGASVNSRYADGATPLEAAAKKFTFSDADQQPFYDVLLAREDIDLLGPGLDDRVVLVNLRMWYARRGSLVEQAEALLTERGIPLPPPQR